MTTKTFNGQLISSKLKKYDHKTGEYIFVEDSDQSSRIGVVSQITYSVEKGLANKLHNIEGPAIQTGKDKQYYINGVRYSKEDWATLRDLGKVDSYIDKSLY
jgi:hypothetical protein